MDASYTKVEGAISYRANLPLIRFAAQTFPPEDKQASAVKIEASEDGKFLHITVFFEGLTSVEQARSFTDAIASQVVNRLTFKLGAFIGNAVCQGGGLTYTYPDGTKHYESACVAQSITFGIQSNDVVTYGEESTRQLLDVLEKGTIKGEKEYYPMYRSAVATDDAIARYMLLYMILLYIFDDSQNKVDKFIRTQDSGVEYKDKPKGFNGKETVYTRLRNQIGHRRKDTSIEDTRTEMNRHVQGLERLVKVAIEVVPSNT